MPVILKNNAFGFLQSAISNSDTVAVLQSGYGANFPSLGGGDYFYATISPTAGASEIVKVVARSGDTLTIVRAQEGTSALSFSAGSRTELRVTAQSVIDAITDRVAGKDQASEISFVPTGGIAATDVQAALAEVDSEKIAFTRLDDSDGSSLVGYTQGGTNATTRTVQTKLREAVSVKDFGAVGDGIANDANAIRAAFAASNSVLFPSGTYYCGQIGSGDSFFDLTDKGVGVAILTQGFVELVGETTTVSECQFFRLLPGVNGAQSHFYCDPIRFRDTGYVSGFPAKGLTAFRIENNDANWGNLRFIGIYCRDVAAAMVVANRSNTSIAANRVRGIFIDEVFVDNGNYGVVLAGQGDGVYIKKLITSQVFRSFFAYNVQEAEVSVFARTQKSTSGVINLGWFTEVTSGPPLQGMKVRYYTRDCASVVNHILINVIGPSLGTIRGVDLDLDIQDAVTGNKAVEFIAYDTSGGVPDTTALANVMTDVIIRGRVGHSSNTISSLANFTTPQTMTLLTTSIPVTGNAFNNFQFTTLRTFVPTWTASSSNPVIGNGTLAGEFFIANGICQVTVTMTAGSTTTFGSGIWSFALPVTCRSINMQRGSAIALDAGVIYYAGSADAAGTGLQATFDQATSQTQATIPFTWASGDSLSMTVSYPV